MTSEAQSYHLNRRFDAPRALVWRALTESDLVSRWYGPGVETINHKFEPVEGGEWLLEMKMGGNSMFQRGDFLTVDEGIGFVCIQANTDAEWNVIDNMMMPGMPRLLALDISLTDEDDGATILDLTWTPHEATPEEVATFTAALDQMGRGWGPGMDIVAEILAEIA